MRKTKLGFCEICLIKVIWWWRLKTLYNSDEHFGDSQINLRRILDKSRIQFLFHSPNSPTENQNNENLCQDFRAWSFIPKAFNLKSNITLAFPLFIQQIFKPIKAPPLLPKKKSISLTFPYFFFSLFFNVAHKFVTGN